MSNKEDELRSELVDLFEQVGIKNITVTVETVAPNATKPHIELRNYNKLMVEFFLALPDGLRETELEILRSKALKGENIYDTIQIPDLTLDGGEGDSDNSIQSRKSES